MQRMVGALRERRIDGDQILHLADLGRQDDLVAAEADFSAASADSIAEATIASRVTSAADTGAGDDALSSIMRVSSAWSSEPQLTPMLTGLSYFSAISIMVANWRSRFSPKPTLPGLMRYLSSASAQAGCSVSSVWPI